MPQVVTCVPAAEGAASAAPCADLGGVPHVPAIVEMSAPGAVSFELANQLFAYGFTIVLAFFAVGVAMGAILSLIRRGS